MVPWWWPLAGLPLISSSLYQNVARLQGGQGEEVADSICL